MPMMTGGEALARSLHREGIRTIFGLPGVQIYHALDGIAKEPEIRFITTRHEQATTYMADGYARASGRIGSSLVVPGPGLLNATAGIGTAFSASSPILVISGQIETGRINQDVGGLHEVHDQLEVVRNISKWRAQVLNTADIPKAIRRAFLELRTGRPRPVVIEIPSDVLSAESVVELLEPGTPPPPSGDSGLMEEAAQALMSARKPLIWAGSGVISAGGSDAMVKLAELLAAPVITTGEGKGAISDDHYLSLGVARGPTDPLRELVHDSDLILAIGTRFATAMPHKTQQVIQIDIDSEEVGRNHERTLGITADARVAIEQLLSLVSPQQTKDSDRMRAFESFRANRHTPSTLLEPQGSFVRELRSAIPSDGILVTDMTQVGYYSRTYYKTYEPRTFMTSSYFGNLGYAYPTGLGAKVACPDKAVVTISGDGGFLFNSQELATAVAEDIGVVAVVFRDDAYGNVLRDQQNKFDGRELGSRLHNPDFVKLAESYGVRGTRVESPSELGVALKNAIQLNRPALIEVPVGPMPSGF